MQWWCRLVQCITHGCVHSTGCTAVIGCAASAVCTAALGCAVTSQTASQTIESHLTRLTRHSTRLAGHARGVVILQGQAHVRTVQEPTSQQMHHLQETNDESSGPCCAHCACRGRSAASRSRSAVCRGRGAISRRRGAACAAAAAAAAAACDCRGRRAMRGAL